MPLNDRDIQANDRTIGLQINGICKPPIFAIRQFLKITAKTIHSLGTVSIPKNRDRTGYFNPPSSPTPPAVSFRHAWPKACYLERGIPR